MRTSPPPTSTTRWSPTARPACPGPTWRVADAQDLPFADDVFDLVVCQFGVMFLPDRIGAYRGVRRVLEPGGSFLFNVWDTLETHEVEAAVIDVMAELFPDDPPDFLRRVPHGYADPNRIRADVQAGGLTVAELERVELTGRAPSAAVLAEGYCLGTPLRFELQDRGDLGDLVPRVSSALARRLGDGLVEGAMAAYVVRAVTRSLILLCSSPGGPSHLVVLGVFAVGVVVLLAIGPLVRGRPVERPLAVALAVGNIVFGLIGTVTEFSDGGRVEGNLPLQLCDFAWVPVAWALLTRHPLALALTYFWGLTLSLQAMAQPTLDEAFPDPNFFAFWGKHVLLVWGAVFATLTLRQGPDWRGTGRPSPRRRSGSPSRCRSTACSTPTTATSTPSPTAPSSTTSAPGPGTCSPRSPSCLRLGPHHVAVGTASFGESHEAHHRSSR